MIKRPVEAQDASRGACFSQARRRRAPPPDWNFLHGPRPILQTPLLPRALQAIGTAGIPRVVRILLS